MLFLDDSGKPDQAHASRAVVIGGFAIDAEEYAAFSRCVIGAKARFFPGRGAAGSYEVKSTELIKPNPWKRRKNRDFCNELARLVGQFDGTVYSCTIDKAKMHHQMRLQTSTPLQLHALVEHFALECKFMGRVGMLVSDWSSHAVDEHASGCVATFARSRRLRVHPGVYYAPSTQSEGVQVADVIAAVRRRVAEGDARLAGLDADLHATRACSPTGRTVRGRKHDNAICLF